jgi:hypothetical protein
VDTVVEAWTTILHWPLIRSAGLVNASLDIFLYTWARDEPGVQHLENWELLAGNMDAV